MRYTATGASSSPARTRTSWSAPQAHDRSSGSPRPASGSARRGDIGAPHARPASSRLEAGDLLVLYTDGITEASNADRRQFDIHRLAAVVQALADRPVAEVCEGILRRAKAWMGGAPQFDDMTLVVARYAP